MNYFDFVTYLKFFISHIKNYKICIPSKPIKSDLCTLEPTYLCPHCHGVVSHIYKHNYCHHCGQRLFWEVLV